MSGSITAATALPITTQTGMFRGASVAQQTIADVQGLLTASATAVATSNALLSALNGVANKPTGTAAGTVAAGDDSRIVGALQASVAATTYATPTGVAVSLHNTTSKLYFADFRAAPGATDATALAAMMAVWVGEVIELPPGVVNLDSLTVNVASGKALVIHGSTSPRSTLVLITGAGITVNLAANSGFDLSGVNFQRGTVGGSTWSATAVSVTSTQAGLPCPVRIRDVDFTGGPTYFQTGIRLNDCQFPELRTIRWYSSAGDPASATFDGCAIVISGSSTSAFAVDHDIVGLTVQGGYAGIRCVGAVQGVYLTNFRIIGSLYGVYWPGVNADFAELLTCSQGHFNTTRAGIYASYVSWVSLNNILSLHNAPDTGGWCAFDLPECYLMTLSNLTCYGLGGGTTFPEQGIRYFASGGGATQPSSFTTSVFASLNGFAVQLGGLVSRTQVSGCIAQATSGVTAATAGNTIFANTRDGVFDVMDATNGIALSNAITKKGGTQNIAMPGPNINLRTDGAVFMQNAAGTAAIGLVAGLVTCAGNTNTAGQSVAGNMVATGLFNAATDAAAAAAGTPINGLYRNGGVIQIRLV